MPAKHFRSKHFDKIYFSDLVRALDTSEILAEDNVSDIEIITNTLLRERARTIQSLHNSFDMGSLAVGYFGSGSSLFLLLLV